MLAGRVRIRVHISIHVCATRGENSPMETESPSVSSAQHHRQFTPGLSCEVYFVCVCVCVHGVFVVVVFRHTPIAPFALSVSPIHPPFHQTLDRLCPLPDTITGSQAAHADNHIAQKLCQVRCVCFLTCHLHLPRQHRGRDGDRQIDRPP